jgi:formate hydrogenlyase transcriptional activator
MELLRCHDWPGNIRELQNFIERAVVFSPGPVLRPILTDLRPVTKQPTATAVQTFAEASRDHILEVLEQSNWRIGGRDGAAERLGIPRTTLIYKMYKLGIDTRRPQRRPSVPLEAAFTGAGAYGALAASL